MKFVMLDVLVDSLASNVHALVITLDASVLSDFTDSAAASLA